MKIGDIVRIKLTSEPCMIIEAFSHENAKFEDGFRNGYLCRLENLETRKFYEFELEERS